ncbi:MAG: type II secretion system major pseudopilin GspG [Pseudomonadota bacterium]
MKIVTINFLLLCTLLPQTTMASPPHHSRVFLANQNIRAIESALEMFYLDHGRYPTSDEGLYALVEKPSSLSDAGIYPAGGYMKKMPDDPWRNPYQYRHPGLHNPNSFDVWSLGADGQPGGVGENGDCGNFGVRCYEKEESLLERFLKYCFA